MNRVRSRPGRVLAVAAVMGLLAVMGSRASARTANSSRPSRRTKASNTATTTLTGGAVNVTAQAGIAQTNRTYSVDPGEPDAAVTPKSIYPTPSLGACYGVKACPGPWSSFADDFLYVRHDPQAAPNIPLPELYINNHTGSFHLGFQGWNPSDRHGCAWGDYNGDGLADLFCAVGLNSGSVNELWRNNGTGSFTSVGKAQGITANAHGRYRTATFVDANGDGWPDIYVTRYNGAGGGPIPVAPDDYPNQLWINKGNGAGFTLNTSMGLTAKASAQKDNQGCNQALDYNGDGTQDIIMCGTSFRLYKNVNHTSFSNVAKAAGLSGFWADAEWGDFNSDGLPDLVQIKPTQVRVMLQRPDHSFSQAWSAPAGKGWNVAVGDLNGDGHLDFYALNSCTKATPHIDEPDRIYYGSAANSSVAPGGSLSFTSQQIPAVPAHDGCGDTVGTINYMGSPAFVVANGLKKNPGPAQLWTWSPTG